MMTLAQLAALKADIVANVNTVEYAGSQQQINALPNNTDANFAIAEWYNGQAAPDFWVFLTSLPINDVRLAIDYAEYQSLTAAQRDGIAFLMGNGTYNPSTNPARLALVALIPASAANTRAAILEAATRVANRIEKLLAATATGPGGGDGSAMTASANLTFEGTISYQDVESARNLP